MIVPARAGNLERVGYFRFVDEFATPICALTKAIEAERERHPNGDISNSLIVVPEAFNIGHDYDLPASDLRPREILEKLHELAAPLRITFVVGILDRRRNSAYWVDANGPELMCHKMGDDLKGLYKRCLRNPDRRNPIACANARIGVLICMDANDNTACIRCRRNKLLAGLREGDGNKILCVPARFTNSTPNPLAFLSVIPDYWYVLGGGVYLGTSFVAHAHAPQPNNPLEARKVQATAPVKNEVRLWLLPQAPAR